MSLSAISHSITTPLNPREFEFNTQSFQFLIPTITAIALGILFVPHFGVGLTAGASLLVVGIAGMIVLKMSGLIKNVQERTSEYNKHLNQNLLLVALFGPIAEEAIFRGGLQPLVTHTIQLIFPAAATALLSPSLTVAATVSIVATGVLFGAVHYLNPHKNAFGQAVSATFGGIGYGLLATHYGIAASVAAHIGNNTIVSVITAVKLAVKRKSIAEDPKIQEHVHKKPKFAPLPA